MVRGSAAAGGSFQVTDWRPAGLPPQPARSVPPAGGGGRGSRKYIALVSGLGVGGDAGEPLAVSLLVDWLTGLLGGPEDQAQAAQVTFASRQYHDSCRRLLHTTGLQSWRAGCWGRPCQHLAEYEQISSCCQGHQPGTRAPANASSIESLQGHLLRSTCWTRPDGAGGAAGGGRWPDASRGGGRAGGAHHARVISRRQHRAAACPVRLAAYRLSCHTQDAMLLLCGLLLGWQKLVLCLIFRHVCHSARALEEHQRSRGLT